MAKPPFRVSTPTANPAEHKVEHVVKSGPAAVFARANDPQGTDDLFAAGRELGGPDHEVGSTTPIKSNDHAAKPEYPPPLPWPAAEPEKDNAGHKPFRLKG